MDWTVVPGYSRVGYHVRRHGWDPPSPELIRGRRYIVTGASSGLGEAICAGLLALGGRVEMVVRDRERGELARRRVLAHRAGDIAARLELAVCDVSDLEDVRRFCAERADAELSGLVHNAGVLTDERRQSAQGHELTFATHVLGPLVMTRALLPALRRGAPSTVIFVSSGGMYTARAQPADLELRNVDFDGPRFYAHAKRLQVILAAELAGSVGAPVAFASMHPGWVDTPGLVKSLPRFARVMKPVLRTPEEGADTVLWLLSGEAASRPSGAFWHDRAVRPEHRLPGTRERPGERALIMSALSEAAG